MKILSAIIIICLCALLSACNKMKPFIPYKDKVDKVIIYDQKSGDSINEIVDSSQIQTFLGIINESKISSFGDPEPPGKMYTIVIQNKKESITYYFKKGMLSFTEDKIYYENSKNKAWVPDKVFLQYFP